MLLQRSSCWSIVLLLLLPSIAYALNVFYIPLDERFTTRNAFLNMAQITPFNITTPPLDIISDQKIPAPLPLLDAFIDSYLPTQDAAVVSLELFVYGGLIPSRCSNDTSDSILARVAKLVDYAMSNPHIQFHLGTVVMRIPAYNEDVEEPWYWALYGADLYTYSYYLDKYQRVSHNQSDYATAMAAAALVPPAIVEEFVTRRQRNYNATVSLLQAMAANPTLFRSLYITLDDNAEYGFNIAESIQLRSMVSSLGLQDIVLIYPGADEVGLSMLARLTTVAASEAAIQEDTKATSSSSSLSSPPHRAQRLFLPTAPVFNLVFRKPDNTSLYLIPNFEGQPMIFTLLDQIAAAGASAAPGNWTPSSMRGGEEVEDEEDVSSSSLSSQQQALLFRPTPILLVNNFGIDEYPQIEAPSQTTKGRSTADYSMFTPYMCGTSQPNATSNVISMADNRYSNGADLLAVEYLYERGTDATCVSSSSSSSSSSSASNTKGLGLDRTAYAGWNTDGNTVGTSISNLVLLYYFADFTETFRKSSQRLATAIDAAAAARRRHLHHSSEQQASIANKNTLSSSLSSSSSFSSSVLRTCGGNQYTPTSCANSYFNLLRFVEDGGWQANLRQQLVTYVEEIDGESMYTLGDDLPFYERYAYKVLASRTFDGAQVFGLNWTLSSAYYPWNRTFEIGLVAV